MNFKLGLYKDEGETLITIEEYLNCLNNPKQFQAPYLDSCWIFLEYEEKEWLADDEWEFGRLDDLVLSFETAYTKISQGQIAIISSCDPENTNPHHLLLEPSEGGMTHLSLFVMGFKEMDLHNFKSVEDFYLYVLEHRSEVLQEALKKGYFTHLAFQTKELLAYLQRESELGRKLIDLFGMPDGINHLKWVSPSEL
jgi:hypothetical protein